MKIVKGYMKKKILLALMKSPVFWVVIAIGIFFCGLMLVVFLTLLSTDSTTGEYQGDPYATKGCYSTGPANLVGNTGAEQSWNWFRSLNFDTQATAGILGNEMWESGGTFDPNVHQQGGPGVGIFQWTFDQRFQDLIRYASSEGLSPYDLRAQLSFAWIEMQHMNLTPAAMNNTGIATSTVTFEQVFENAGKPQNDQRINDAQQVYNLFANNPPPTGTTQTPAATPVINNTCGSSGDTGIPTVYGNASPKAKAVIQYEMQFVGKVWYLWGGTTPLGFDCSGLQMYSFKNSVGVLLPRTSEEQANAGTRIPASQMEPGDLIFKETNGVVDHVGLYIGSGKIINAPQTGEMVKIVDYHASYWTDYAVRVLN